MNIKDIFNKYKKVLYVFLIILFFHFFLRRYLLPTTIDYYYNNYYYNDLVNMLYLEDYLDIKSVTKDEIIFNNNNICIKEENYCNKYLQIFKLFDTLNLYRIDKENWEIKLMKWGLIWSFSDRIYVYKKMWIKWIDFDSNFEIFQYYINDSWAVVSLD